MNNSQQTKNSQQTLTDFPLRILAILYDIAVAAYVSDAA